GCRRRIIIIRVPRAKGGENTPVTELKIDRVVLLPGHAASLGADLGAEIGGLRPAGGVGVAAQIGLAEELPLPEGAARADINPGEIAILPAPRLREIIELVDKGQTGAQAQAIAYNIIEEQLQPNCNALHQAGLVIITHIARKGQNQRRKQT